MLTWLALLALVIAACAPAATPTAAPAKPVATAPPAATAAPPKPAATAAPAAPAATTAPAKPAATVAAAPKPLTPVRFAIAQKPFNPGVSNLYLGKELGFFQEEGIDLDPISTAGGNESAQLVATRQAEFGYNQIDPMLLSAEKGQDLGLVAFYTIGREIFFELAVKPDSSYTSIKQLKGKTIGPSSMASTGLVYAKTALKAEGLDPEKDATYVAVGTGAQAADALYKDRVDALALWDAQYAIMENAGFKLRILPHPPAVQGLWGGAIVSVQRDYLKANPNIAIGFARGVAKGTAFMIANPEAAVRIHWKMFPESKPKGIEEAQSLKDEIRVIESRLRKFDPAKSGKIPKFGAASPEEIEYYAKNWLGVNLPDLSKFYDMSLIDKINDFDVAKIQQLAKAYR